MGYAQMLLDIKTRKQKKLSLITSVAVIGGLALAGFLSKEIIMIYGIGTAMNLIAEWLI